MKIINHKITNTIHDEIRTIYRNVGFNLCIYVKGKLSDVSRTGSFIKEPGNIIKNRYTRKENGV